MHCYPVAADLPWSVLSLDGDEAWMRMASTDLSADVAIVTLHFMRSSMVDPAGVPP
jgi:hypothetical protein